MMASTSSRTAASQDRPHRGRNLQPLATLRQGLAPSLRGQTVVLARSSRFAVAPAAPEQSGSLHVMEGRVQRPFLQLKRARAASLGLPEEFVAVHFALAQEAQDENADGAGEEFAIVLHA